MIAVQYIVGMVNNPVESLLQFIQSYQDAKISLERLNEIYEAKDEVDPNQDYITTLPENHDIVVHDLTFRYLGVGNEPIFNRLNLVLAQNSVASVLAAIVPSCLLVAYAVKMQEYTSIFQSYIITALSKLHLLY